MKTIPKVKRFGLSRELSLYLEFPAGTISLGRLSPMRLWHNVTFFHLSLSLSPVRTQVALALTIRGESSKCMICIYPRLLVVADPSY